MERLFVIVAVCLGMFGCMASQLNSVRAPEIASAEQSSHTIDIADRPSRYASHPGSEEGGAIVLERQDDGHFYAPVEINGTEITMLIDTGASGVALSADDARQAGIARSIGMSDEVGEGAGGTVRGDFVQLGRVKLGHVESSDVPAVILNGGSMSLLGQSFLRQFASVQIVDDRMILQ